MFWYLSIYNYPKLFNCIVRTRYVWKCENVCAGRAEHLMVRGKTFCYNDSSKRLRSTLWKAHQVVLTFQWEWKPTIMWVIDRFVGFFLFFLQLFLSLKFFHVWLHILLLKLPCTSIASPALQFFLSSKNATFLSYLRIKYLSCKILTVLHQSKTNLSDFDKKLQKQGK